MDHHISCSNHNYINGELAEYIFFYFVTDYSQIDKLRHKTLLICHSENLDNALICLAAYVDRFIKSFLTSTFKLRRILSDLNNINSKVENVISYVEFFQ